MSDYMTFQAKLENFRTPEDYKSYRQKSKCLVCDRQLENGEEWRFQALQTPEEAGSLTVLGGIVHRKCVDMRGEGGNVQAEQSDQEAVA